MRISRLILNVTLAISVSILSLGCKGDSSSQPSNSSVSSSSEPSSSSGGGKAEISVKVNGMTTGQAVMVATMADQNYKIDTASIKSDGSFGFYRDGGYPSGTFFIILPNNSNFQFLLDDDQTKDFSRIVSTGEQNAKLRP